MTTSSPVRTAELANRTLIEKGTDGFSAQQATLFAYCSEGIRVLGTTDDIYGYLEQLHLRHNLETYETGIGIVTLGWAAPLPKDYDGDEDEITAPSQHPEKRRVRLSSCVERDGSSGSAMRFQDEPDEVITDEGTATGSLASAVLSALSLLIAKNN